MSNEKQLIDIWYGGLNEPFRKTRGPMATAGCHDNPQVRLFYYAVAGIALSAAALAALILIPFLREIPWLAGACGIVALGVLFQAALFFKAFFSIRKAIREGHNTDYADPLRFKVMEKALSWGLKKNLVERGPEGNYRMKKT